MPPLTREQVRAAILTAQQASDRLGIVRQTLYVWRAAGHITPILDTGNAQIYFVGDVERVLQDPAYRERLKMGRPPASKRDRAKPD